MQATIATLTLAYVLSQFYRAFLAVLSPLLTQDLGIPAEVLARASGWWFLAFAAAQLPVGWALDRIGPRVTSAGLMAVAALGAALFALARDATQIDLAMVLIGLGCAPVLMASYFIFAREFSPAVFGTLAGMVIGFGSLGNIAASAPLGWAAAALGWRGAIWVLAGVTAAVALALALIVRDPDRLPHRGSGSIQTLLAMPRLWPILVMMAACYAPAAGLRGLWAGPYFTEVFGADRSLIGTVTLVMGLAMVAGNFAYGPLERSLGTRKWLNFGGNLLVLACLVALALLPAVSPFGAAALLAGIGLFGASFPMVVAHGRAFLPPALVGRGVTLLNLFGIGMTGVMQMVTGALKPALPAGAPAYSGLFLAYAALVVLGLLVYLWAQDRTD
jgi:predicted MFS family arabinose efflux permease